MRWIFHTHLPEWNLCNMYISTGLDLYDLQDNMYDLPAWNMYDLDDLYILTRMRFAGSV